MTQTIDLHKMGVSYKIFDKSNTPRFVKTIYVISLEDVLEYTGEFDVEHEFAFEHLEYAATRFRNHFDLKRISWFVVKDGDTLRIEDAATKAMAEDTDIIIVEYLTE